MIHYFIKMIDKIHFLCGFIYECANLINNLYEYNEHVKDIIDNLESIKDKDKIQYLFVFNEYLLRRIF